MLSVREVSAHHGEASVLRGVSLEVAAGEVVTLVGRNGAGKTTLLRCLTGLHRSMTGEVRLDGRDITKLAPHRRCRLGLGYVPDDRGIYATLTVEENLTLPPTVGPDAWPLDKVYEAFPALADRRRQAGTHLSGGEQQMLSVARVLRMGARLLLADEPTEGLSPILVRQIGDIIRTVKEHRVTVLLIEQNIHFASTVADRHYLISQGRVVETLDNAEVERREHELLEYLGI
ncbi:ABC transporter ATP-binding protein [Actinophytocola oryzae]|uniref:Amino acid/amide ABC transporter ATP-binding protein 2 (HAAT family) n=1 Tax=Actinophytocola oryzae TaxID=502181 RepID=A0A4R7V872_9PSEU|nr:ABC transporter ATP-binding protein [Actinophytocola oryzae]TDV44795.1 amino acid/amide ABC transporter ATP-binding protein 2 (HAAT family) [Actinophytocola oryzae]